MKTRLLIWAFASTLPLLLITGCGGSEDTGPVTVEGYEEYTDPSLNFQVLHPKGWAPATNTVANSSSATFYTSKTIFDAFKTFDPKGERGAKIEVKSILGGETALNESIASLKKMFNDPSVLKGPEKTTMNGGEATKFSYSFPINDEIDFTSERYYVMNDTVVTYIETAVFGNYENYSAIFDTVRGTLKPGELKRMAVDTSTGAVRDSIVLDPPSSTMKTYSNAHFSVSYPDNFDASSGRAGGSIASATFSGTRNDSFYQIDVLDSKGLTLDKVVEQNKSRYGGRNASKTSVGGNTAYVFNYSGGKDVSSQAYFVSAAGKIYRITLNWYTPQAEHYKPAFQKALASFKAK